MKKSIVIMAFCIGGLLIGNGCAQKVTRIGESQQVDLSGRWNDTDSRLVSEEMVKDGLARTWLLDFVEAQGKKPVVIVGIIKNKTSEHISSETFINDIEREFINSGKVKLAQGGEAREDLRQERGDQQDFASLDTAKKWGLEKGADFMLQGYLNSITDSNNREKAMFYQVDLVLTDLESNEKVWIGSKKIKKAEFNP
ncbi:penicillin-binding protein activator LpoB [Maribacter arcticus]|uniref:Penicillin-binding protein activator LpoB n=1 Tax=Maribacter arcticus TaxID=561365 RepID=A0A1T5CIJ3_9FLAO|nr:penicillin-binding protein activator LpoB [Maribacter arcticus]SKB58960.1 hypothetical protein SAMN05660866_02306 [Maribacter arcticus]